MNTNEIQTVVNMVSDKVGSAIEKITPLANEVIQQYQMRALGFTFIGVAFIIIAIVLTGLCLWSFKNSNTLSERWECDGFQSAGIILGLLSFVTAVTGFSMAIVNLGNYLAPICGLIGK